MPPEKPPQMPKRAMDSSFKEEEHPRASNGEFTKGNAEKPTENRYNEKKRRYRDLSHEPMITKINPSGVNKFPEQVFKNLAKAKNHYEKHTTKLLEAGIHSYEEYLQSTKMTIESAVGGEIRGHANSQKQIIRYNTKINLFVKGNPDRGVFTSFVPDGEPGKHYSEVLEEDLNNGGSR